LDVIAIYKDEICEDAGAPEEVRDEVHETVLHEIGH
jgi:predicted Zn-dependent protease with MMP-like domain